MYYAQKATIKEHRLVEIMSTVSKLVFTALMSVNLFYVERAVCDSLRHQLLAEMLFTIIIVIVWVCLSLASHTCKHVAVTA